MRKIPTFAVEQALDLHPLTVESHTSLTDVIGLMSQTSIHCPLQSGEEETSRLPSMAEQSTNYVLVLDNSQLVGILTERDIVRLIAEYRTLAELTVASVMSGQVMTLQAEDNQDVFSALNLMRQYQIQHLPVVDEQEQVLGVLTPRRLRRLHEPADLMKLRQVHEVMNSTVIHALPTDSVLKVTQMMNQHRISCVVIVEASGSSKSHKPIGILTERDIVQVQRLELNLEHTQAQEVMSTPLSLVNSEDSLWTVHIRMQHHKVRHLVVADLQGDLQGIVTQNHLSLTDPEEVYEVLELLQRQVETLQAKNAQLQTERTLEGEVNRQTDGHHRIDSELRAANQRLGWHVENSPLAIVEWNSQFRVESWSQQAEIIFGWSAAEVLGKHWTDWRFVVEADLDAVMVVTDDLLKGREPRNISHNRNYTRDGLVIDCDWYNSALLDHSGNLISILSLAQDVTARKQSEVALKESEERFRYLADHAPVLIWIAGCDKNCSYFNKHWLDFTGRTMEQELGNGWAEGVHPDDLQFCLDTYNHSFDARHSFEMEYRLRRVDGEYRWVFDVGVPRFDTNKEFLGYIGSCIDISDRKESEHLLKLSEQRYRTLTDAVQHLVWVANAEGLSYDFNEQCQTYLGMTVEEIQGHGWVNAVHPDDAELALSQWQESLQNTTPFEAEYRIRRSDGVYRWHVVRSIPHFVNGQVQEWIGSCTDIDDLKQTESALRESEECQRLALDAAFMGVWDWQVPTDHIIWSGHHYELFGLTPDTFDGSFDAFMNCVHPDDHTLIFEAIESSKQNQVPYEVEFRIIWPDGSLHHMSARGKFYYSADGEPLRMLGMVMDVSDRQQAEAHIHEMTQRLTLATSSAKIGVWDFDVVEDRLIWDDRMYELYGIKAEEFGGAYEAWKQGVHPDDLTAADANIQTAIAGEREFHPEFRVVWPDGQVRFIEAHAIVLRDDTGKALRMIGVNWDITERKLAEVSLHRQALMFQNITDGVILTDPEGYIIDWNPAAEKMFGYTKAEVLGQTPGILYRDEESVTLTQQIIDVMTREGQWSGEITFIRKDGTIGLSETVVVPFLDDQGQLIATIGLNHDITEKKQLEAQYLRAQRLESIGTLAGGIAHDLNNILTPIVGIAGLLPLKIPHLDEQSQHLIEMLQVSAHRGADLVQQILSFSRGIEGNRMMLQVGHLISEVKDFVEKTFPKAIKLEINLPNDLRLVNGDATQLHQVLMNLCVNARDAMPCGGTLSLSAENLKVDETYAQMYLEAQVGPYVVISVADTGVGMAPETLERIFDPFFTTKEVGKGTGLGLSTLMGIVKSHGGFVTVESQVRSGTKFVVYLPAVDDTNTPQPEADTYAVGQGELILVVDDEAPIREITTATLEAYNYRVIPANTGIEAISQYGQHQDDIDAILMDMMMPEMDGATAIQTLKAINPQVKIIVVTGLVSREQNPADTNLEVDAFLSKPYKAETLMNVLKGVLKDNP